LLKYYLLPSVGSAFKLKTLTLANRYKMKTLANGYKSTKKKMVANVFICLLLHLPFAIEKDKNSFYRIQQLFYLSF